MTVVGKLLLFLSLVFSLAAGAFAMLLFIARTNYADKYDSLSKRYQALDASSKSWKADYEKLDKERKALNARLIAAARKDLDLKGLDDPDADKAGIRAAKLLDDRGKAIDKLQGDIVGLKNSGQGAKQGQGVRGDDIVLDHGNEGAPDWTPTRCGKSSRRRRTRTSRSSRT